MAIDVQFDHVDITDVLPNAPVQAEDGEGRKMPAKANALDEFVNDRAAPRASTQTIIGHEHGLEGGGPIVRGMIFSTCGGDTPVHTEDFSTATSYKQALALGVINNSPGLAKGGGTVLGAVRYKATSSPWLLRLSGGQEVQVEAFDEGDLPRWVFIEGAILRTDWLTEQMRLFMTPGNVLDPDASLKIYSIIVWETWRHSQPHRRTTVDPKPLAGNYDVHSWPNAPLDDIMFQNGDWVDAWAYGSLAMRSNALFEHITDRNAPGASSQEVKGHDHYDGAGGYEGRPVPMGCTNSIWLWDGYIWNPTLTTQNTWYYIDHDATNRRTTAASTPGGTKTTDPEFVDWTTHGFSSSGSPPSSTPYKVAALRFEENGTSGKTYEVRIYNITTGTVSATTSFTGAGATTPIVYVDKVPCSGGAANDLAIEIRCTSDNNADIELKGRAVFEVGQFQGTDRTYISSSGSVALSVANKVY